MASIYVPRPPVDDYTKSGGTNVPATLIAQLAAFPVARPPYWKYHNDSPGFWVGGRTNQNIPPVRMPVGGGFPFKPTFWPNNYDDSAFWVGTPNRSIPELDEPVGGGYPFKPPYWKYHHDDPGFWVGGKSRPVFIPNLSSNFISATAIIELPINCVMAGDQVYSRSGLTVEGPPKPRITYTVRMGRPKN